MSLKIKINKIVLKFVLKTQLCGIKREYTKN